MHQQQKSALIGTAGWNIPAEAAGSFPRTGSHLERYSQTLNSVEINSSFYRHHMAATYKRWADSTPPGFRFSVKLAKAFTHEARLLPSGDSLRACLEAIAQLGEKWGTLLVQLPPSLVFEKERAKNFLQFLKDYCPAPVVWEPRHPTWTTAEALELLARFEVPKVIADPEPCPLPPSASLWAGDHKLRYYRLHGSPIIYRSSYRPPFLKKLARQIEEAPSRHVWCVFDNTTFGFAALNALELRGLLGHGLQQDRIVS